MRRAGIFVLFCVLAAVMTWPQAARMATHVNDAGDPLLNAWAQAWVLHQAARDPLRLFDGNIFHPERYTLAYSEPLIVPALLVAPVRWAGGSALLAYNVSMLLALALSGVATAALVRHLTGSFGAGMVAGVVFAFLPFRIDHYAHLQLQWSAWMPLTLLGLHRTLQRAWPRDAVLMAAAYAAQAMSCLYYAVYFGTILGGVLLAVLLWRSIDWRSVRHAIAPPVNAPALRAVIVVLQVVAAGYLLLAWWIRDDGFTFRLMGLRIRAHDPLRLLLVGTVSGGAAVVLRWWAAGIHKPARLWRAPLARAQLRGLLFGVVLSAVLLLPVGWAYLRASQVVGHRGRELVGGARLTDYVGAPAANRIYGELTREFGGGERRLFPGVLPVALATAALWRRPSAITLIYAAGTAFALDISLGFNGLSYESLYRWLLPFRGLRVASRAGLLVGLGLAVLAGFGAARAIGGVRAGARRAVVALLCLVSLAEAWSVPLEPLERIPDPPAVYRWLSAIDTPSTIVELPVGPSETHYMYYSTLHWHRLLNGYSGFFPQSWVELQERMRTFPDVGSIEYLRARDVDLVIDHRPAGSPSRSRVAGLIPAAAFTDAARTSVVYRVER